MQRMRKSQNPKSSRGSLNSQLREVLHRKDIIEPKEILKTYGRKNPRTNREGELLIENAYRFAYKAFANAAQNGVCRPKRKDGQTEIFAHSSSVSYMGAILGGGANWIAALALHDVVEDCQATFEQIQDMFGDEVATYLMLLTKPKALRLAERDELVFSIYDPERWQEIIEDKQTKRDCYARKLTAQYSGILDTRHPKATPRIKIHAYIGKILDALSNLYTDQHLERTKAAIRALNLMLHIRHLEILSPTLRGIIKDLLAARNYVIPNQPNHRTKPEGKVIEIPPYTSFNQSYLDGLPLPGRHIEVCTADAEIKRKLEAGNLHENVVINFPHGMQQRLEDLVRNKFAQRRLTELEIVAGESLLPAAVDGASSVVTIGKIGTTENYQIMLKALAELV